MKMKVFAKSL